MRRLFLSAPPITPRSIPGCVLWLEADRIPQGSYASDSFTRADSASSLGTADSGQAWSAPSGTWGISGNKAYSASATNGDRANLPAGVRDAVFSVDITSDNYSVSNPGLMVRFVDNSNFLYVDLQGGNARILKVVANATTSLASAAFTPTNSVTYNLKAACYGDVIALYVDNVLKATTTLSGDDSTLFSGATATGVGLRFGKSSGTPSLTWDNLAVRLNNDGDPLNAWPDLSGLGNHATQSTPTNQPAVKTGIVNGRPVVRFASASSQYLKADTLAAALGGSDVPFTAVWVGRLADTPGSNYAWFGLGRSSTANPLHYGLSNGSGLLLGQRRDDAATSKSTTATGTLDTAAHVFAHVFWGTTLDQLVDGAGSTGNDLDVGTITFDQFALGTLNRTTAANFLNGDLAFFGLWNRALSARELSALGRKYLGPKYAVAVS
jgi:hypothetical protein